MWTEDKLDALLSQPSEALIEDIKALSGDIILLGAGGKVGPNLALMAKSASSRFPVFRIPSRAASSKITA